MYLCYILIVIICFSYLNLSDCAKIDFGGESLSSIGTSGKTTGRNEPAVNEDNEYAASVVEVNGNQGKPADRISAHKKHLEKKKGSKASKFGEKKGHKKGHQTRGYHNRFHKDEYHKEHKLYDDPTKRSNHK